LLFLFLAAFFQLRHAGRDEFSFPFSPMPRNASLQAPPLPFFCEDLEAFIGDAPPRPISLSLPCRWLPLSTDFFRIVEDFSPRSAQHVVVSSPPGAGGTFFANFREEPSSDSVRAQTVSSAQYSSSGIEISPNQKFLPQRPSKILLFFRTIRTRPPRGNFPYKSTCARPVWIRWHLFPSQSLSLAFFFLKDLPRYFAVANGRRFVNINSSGTPPAGGSPSKNSFFFFRIERNSTFWHCVWVQFPFFFPPHNRKAPFALAERKCAQLPFLYFCGPINPFFSLFFILRSGGPSP